MTPTAEILSDNFSLHDDALAAIWGASCWNIPFRMTDTPSLNTVTILNGEVKPEGSAPSPEQWALGDVGSGSDEELVEAVRRCAGATAGAATLRAGSGRLVIRRQMQGQWVVRRGRLHAMVSIRAGWEPIDQDVKDFQDSFREQEA